MCMAPLARGRMFGYSDLSTMAKELGRTEAELAIRWSLQKGLSEHLMALKQPNTRGETAQNHRFHGELKGV